MRKISLGILIIVTVLAISGVAVAISNQAVGAARENAKAPDLEKIEFIHWKKGFAKPDFAKASKLPACYKFLTRTKIKWTKLPASYQINPTNPQNLDQSFIANAIFNSAETWDAATSKELMNDTYTIDSAVVYGVQDYKNAIDFGNYPTAGVIAVTTVWYNPVTKSIVEFDIRFDTDYIWGDAGVSPSISVMDLQNIATHEFGHGVGLADVYESACSLVTMYGYSQEGEIQKRTLEQPDITGLRVLYGI